MEAVQDYGDIFAKKFTEMGIAFMIDEGPVSEEFEKYSGDLISSWVAFAIMHDEPEVFMMMLHNISKMRRLDTVGRVSMAIAGQGFNPYGNQIPPELDAIMSVVHAEPSVELIVETFNTLGHTHVAYLDAETVKFKSE